MLRAKTGTGKTPDGRALGWYVGYVERAGKVHVFAVNRSGADYDDIPRKQTMSHTWQILAELGALPSVDLN